VIDQTTQARFGGRFFPGVIFQRVRMMTGTLKTTENGSHTWTRGTTIDRAVERFKKLGTVTRRNNKLTVTRFCGGKIRAEFFPCG